MKFNFLVIGAGAREHAICQKLLQSKFLNKLFLADANDGFCNLGENLNYVDFDDLAKKAQNLKVDILVVGSEVPLAQGIVNIFEKYNIKCIGANKYFTQLESSKSFAKTFMNKNGIKTPNYKIITCEKEINTAFHFFNSPFTIKADGLCGGKGVIIEKNKKIAQKIIKDYLNGKFNEASKKVLLEEFIKGDELSLISAFDGKKLKAFIPARDFKKLTNDENSPNTGGMGAIAPVSLTELQQNKLGNYLKKLEKSLIADGYTFTGFIYSGLIWAKNDFYVLEYNMRLGDPETQVLLMNMNSDFGELLYKIAYKKLDEYEFQWANTQSCCLVVATEGYPISKNQKDGELIENYDDLGNETEVFFAGVKCENNNFYSKGGRVLSLCTNSPKNFELLYDTAEKLKLKHKFYRKDLKID